MLDFLEWDTQKLYGHTEGNLSEISGDGRWSPHRDPGLYLLYKATQSDFLSQPPGLFFRSKQPSPFFYLCPFKVHLNQVSKNDPFYRSLLRDILLLNLKLSTAPYFMQIKAEVLTRHYEALLYQFPLPNVQRSQRRLVENEAREVMGVDRIGPCFSTNTQGTFIFRYSSAWCDFLPCIRMAVFHLFQVFGQIFFSVISDLSHLTLSNLLLLPIFSLLFLPTADFITFVCPYVMSNILLYCIHYIQYPISSRT